MRLTETSEFQKEGGKLWGDPEISIRIQSRDVDEDELIESTYIFTRGLSEEEWLFSEYNEKRCDASTPIIRRDWRSTERITWDKAHLSEVNVDIPQYVVDRLDEMLELNVVKLQ